MASPPAFFPSAYGSRKERGRRTLYVNPLTINLLHDQRPPTVSTTNGTSPFEIAYLLLENGADYMSPKPYYADTFMAFAKDLRPENYSYDAHVELWCRKVLEWLVAHGADPKKAEWNGTAWEIK